VDGANLIRINVTGRSEEPFEEVVLFTNADAPGAIPEGVPQGVPKGVPKGVPQGQSELWWKFSKYMAQGTCELPQYLYAPPEALLLLRD
jgi:hypothetical protein